MDYPENLNIFDKYIRIYIYDSDISFLTKLRVSNIFNVYLRLNENSRN